MIIIMLCNIGAKKKHSDMTTLLDPGKRTYRHMLSSLMLMKECGLKSLRDLCLDCVGKNLHCITRSSQYLVPFHKELIIERLAFHDGFTAAYLPHVTYNLFSPWLERINLYSCDQIDDKWTKQLAESKCKLRFLTIHGCDNVNDAALRHITNGQDELVELELRKLNITKKGIVNIKSPCLKKVDFRGCCHLNNAAIGTVVSTNRSIKYLSLVACNKLTEPVIRIVAQRLKANLECLDVAEVHMISDACILSLVDYCPNLKSLNILSCRKVTEASIIPLFKKCKQLESLDLSYCAKLVQDISSSQQLMQNLPMCLQELSLNGVQLKDMELLVSGVTRLEKLVILKLCGVPALNDESLEQIMKKIGGQLEQFDISGSVMSSITDEGMRCVTTYCKRLRMLGISLLKGVTGITLVPLLANPQRAPLFTRLLLCLRQLDLSVIHAVTDNCYNLQEINLSGISIITDDILSQLAMNCSQLTDINIKACKNVTDAGVLALAIHCPLCVLVLSGLHNITDKSIICIANNCPYLESLSISGCDKVSGEAVYYLTDVCIPRVAVYHRLPNVSSTA